MPSSNKKTLFLFAGELSGDLLGAQLAKALKAEMPHCHLIGVGGPEMRREGVTSAWDMEAFCVMGFVDVLKSFPLLTYNYLQIQQFLINTAPDAVIFIDSPAFSLRMAKALRSAGYKGKIIQYVAPSVWAWGKHRIQELEKSFDLLLVIYPFELKLFKESSLPVKYVGNPIEERVKNYSYDANQDWLRLFGIKQHVDLVGLFPGSRASEIKANLPVMLGAAAQFMQMHPKAQFAISCAHDQHLNLIKTILNRSPLHDCSSLYFIPKAYSYDLMKLCCSAIAKSGTVTLELALHFCPTVVVYEVSTINYWIAHYLYRIDLPQYCIANILYEKTVFPEIIQRKIQPHQICEHLIHLHEKGPEREKTLTACYGLTEVFSHSLEKVRAIDMIKQTIT